MKFLLFLLPLLGFADSSWISEHIQVIPDFPKPGIQFQWIGPLLRNPDAFDRAVHEFAARYRDQQVDAVLGLEARGFIFGAALAQRLGVSFVPVRKAGKLPVPSYKACYEKEYGPDCLELEIGALAPGAHVVIVDDLIATGGTALAACELASKSGAHVLEVACLIELPFLKAREKIHCPLFTLLQVND